MSFAWDPVKNEINKRKHGFSFENAILAFSDPFFLEAFDKEHSSLGEVRYFGLGVMQNNLLIAISYTDNGDVVRIISARVATNKEREIYNASWKKFVCR